MRRCPHHAIPEWLQVQTFYNRLIPSIRAMVDSLDRGSLNNKTLEEEMNLIETMAVNHYSTPSERNLMKRGVVELDTLNTILAQNQVLSQQLNLITKQLG